MSDSLVARLLDATSPDRTVAGVAVAADYRPLGERVMPPSFPGNDSPQYLIVRPGSDDLEDGVGPWVAIDQVQSQANRVEEALNDAIAADEVALPLFRLALSMDLRDIKLTSLDLPHRYADAYLRDCRIDGVPFDKTDVGLSLRKASKTDVSALYRREPYSLLYGAWDSHRKGHQQKFARLYTSEMWGEDWVPSRRAAGRYDPYNLSGQAIPTPDGGWDFAPTGTKAAKSAERLSKNGHGHIPPTVSDIGGGFVSVVRRRALISSAGLARLRFGRATGEAAHLARATLMALALYADRLAFGAPSVWLRSGCDLVKQDERIVMEKSGGESEPLDVDTDSVRSAFEELRDRTAEAGLAMDRDIIDVTPDKGLKDALQYSIAKAEPGETEG